MKMVNCKTLSISYLIRCLLLFLSLQATPLSNAVQLAQHDIALIGETIKYYMLTCPYGAAEYRIPWKSVQVFGISNNRREIKDRKTKRQNNDKA